MLAISTDSSAPNALTLQSPTPTDVNLTDANYTKPTIPLDVWRCVVTHVAPRHAYKLMQTSKALHEIVRQHGWYWTRVAAHLVFREVLFMNPWHAEDAVSEGQKMQEVLEDENFDRGLLKYLVNLPCGYKVAMDELERVISRDIADHQMREDVPDSEEDEDAPPTAAAVRQALEWDRLARAPLAEQLDAGLRHRVQTLRIDKSAEGQFLANMMEAVQSVPDPFVKSKVLVQFNSYVNKGLQNSVDKFVRRVDDLGLPSGFKRTLSKMLLDAFRKPMDLNDVFDRFSSSKKQRLAYFHRIETFVCDRYLVRETMGLGPPDAHARLSEPFVEEMQAVRILLQEQLWMEAETRAALTEYIVEGFECELPTRPALIRKGSVSKEVLDAWCEVAEQYHCILLPLTALML